MPDCQIRKNTKNPNLEKKNGGGGGGGEERGGRVVEKGASRV